MTTIRIQPIVFSQDDTEDSAPLGILYPMEGVVMHGATTESIIDCAEHLSQWDYDEQGEHENLRAPFTHEERWFVRPDRDDTGWIVYTESWAVTGPPFHDGAEPAVGDYVLTANPRLGYVALDRIVEVTP